MHGYRYPAHEARDRRARPRRRLHPGLAVARGQPADEAGLPGRHDGGRRLPLADPAALRRPRCAAELQGVRLLFMQSNGGLHRGARASAARTRSCPGPPAASSAWPGPRRRRASPGSSASTWAAPPPTCRTTPASSSGEYETQVAGVRMRAPMMSIHTVAAGGGSILHFDGQPVPGRPRLGRRRPRPGLLPARRPAHRHRRERACSAASSRRTSPRSSATPATSRSTRRRYGANFADLTGSGSATAAGPRRCAAGFLRIAVANMANAIKKISVQRGHDVTRYVLATFGGAGGQHACAVADALGMTRVLIHPFAGVLSAYGMGLADVTAMREQAVEAPLSVLGTSGLDAALAPLSTTGALELSDEGLPAERITVDAPGPPALRRHRHRGRGRLRRGRHDARRVRAALPAAVLLPHAGASRSSWRRCPSELTGAHPRAPRRGRGRRPGSGQPTPASRVRMFTGGLDRGGPLPREELCAGDVVDGPAIIAEANATTVVDPGWQAARHRPRPPADAADGGPTPEPRRRHRGGPGHAGDLQQPVHVDRRADGRAAAARPRSSVNIKERLDFSCALFDAEGRPDRQRPAHAGPPGLDGRVHQDGDRGATPGGCGPATSTSSTTRTAAAPTCPTSPW